MTDKDGYISIKWHTDDVIRRADETGAVVTKEQAMEILEDIEANHDAPLGVTWDTIDFYLDLGGYYD